ncbi:MAG: hypothetical protein JO349_03615, partial [Candidatus Eremiobacteraeota bacterium]|nr:hypothetical protein [Candidatus Eremiobacteraeota bacterium]
MTSATGPSSAGPTRPGPITRFKNWLADIDARRGEIENPIARLTGREFYALVAGAAVVVILLLMVAWRSGVNAGAGQLPYRMNGAATNTGGTTTTTTTTTNGDTGSATTSNAT